MSVSPTLVESNLTAADVGVKTGRSRVGGSRTMRLRIVGNKGQVGHNVYPGLGPLNEGKPYVLLDCI